MNDHQAQLPYKLCEELKDNGVQCGQPAVSGQLYCRFHIRARTPMSPSDSMYELPIMETERSVQLALQQLTRGVLTDRICDRKAAVLLSAIKTAANLIKQRNQNGPRDELLHEIATELLGHMETNRDPRKPVQSVDSNSAGTATAS